jgi:hypothetical protein
MAHRKSSVSWNCGKTLEKSGKRAYVRLQNFCGGPYDATFTGGASVAALDVDGDGKADIITGAGPNGGPHVRIFSGATPGLEFRSFFAFDPGFIGGVYVG